MNQASTPDPQIPFARLSPFIRQVTHDIRNGLNAMDLEAAFIAEIVTDPEAIGEVRKLRQMISNVAKSLQQLSVNFGALSLNTIDIPARDFFASIRERVETEFAENAGRVEWRGELGGESIDLDFELMITALTELFRNAFQFSESGTPIIFRATTQNGAIVFELNEQPKIAPESTQNWGGEPLLSTKRGGYGLGLFRARRIIEAHGGQLEATISAGRLLTSVQLPILTAA